MHLQRTALATLVAPALAGCGGNSPISTTSTASAALLSANDVPPVSLYDFSRIVQETQAAHPTLPPDGEAFRQILLRSCQAQTQSVRGPVLTREEWALVIQYPVYAVLSGEAAHRATEAAKTEFPGNQALTKADAYRHSYWNALMAKRCGQSWAEAFGTAHESETPEGDDKAMDLSNNSTGRRLVAENPQMTEAQLAATLRSGIRFEYVPRGVTFDDTRLVHIR